jgi:hypothetical protein
MSVDYVDLGKTVLVLAFGTFVADYLTRKYSERKSVIDRKTVLIDEYIEVFNKHARLYLSKGQLFGSEYEDLHPLLVSVLVKLRMTFSSNLYLIDLLNDIDGKLNMIRGELKDTPDQEYRAQAKEKLAEIHRLNSRIYDVFCNPRIWASEREIRNLAGRRLRYRYRRKDD